MGGKGKDGPAAGDHLPAIPAGTRVFYLHSERSWEVGVVKEVEEEEPPYKYTIDSEKRPDSSEHVSEVDVHRVDSDADKAKPRDLLSLKSLHVAVLLAVVENRFLDLDIYTFIGNLVIAVNPFRRDIPHYFAEESRKYIAAGWEGAPLSHNGDLRPHSWAVANKSYWDMVRSREEPRNQSILISGESGAGKTEGTKIILQYLGDLCAERVSRNDGTAEEKQAIFAVNEKLQSASPILEAFGNAKTTRNDNSSRFGKFQQIQFNTAGILVGMHCTPYLLEKSRVVTAGPQERLYHAFYQLAAGAPPEMRAMLKLEDIKHYKSLQIGGCLTIPGVNDKADFEAVQKAMRTVGFTETDAEGCWRVVAACLHLSTVEFLEPPDSKDPPRLAESSVTAIFHAADVLQIDREGLKSEMLYQTRTMKHEPKPIRTARSVEQSKFARNSFCVFVYENCFLWMISRINEMTSKPYEQATYIGLLDIFGFENFNLPGQKNSFEQLCINLANERLQNHYNKYVYKRDTEEMADEGVAADVSVDGNDNQLCLDLIVNNRDSILSILDDICQASAGKPEDDANFLSRCGEAHAKDGKEKGGKRTPEGRIVVKRTKPSDFFELVPRFKNQFKVHHYAGEVKYDVSNFAEKNRAKISDQTKSLLRDSKHELVVAITPKEEPPGSPGGPKAKGTVANAFKRSLHALMETIEQTKPNWVRCIRPNPQKVPMTFDTPSVLEQLICSGVVETVKIRQQGFCYREEFDNFVHRYAALSDSRKRDARERCASILRAVSLDKTQAQVGKKAKVFMKVKAFRMLEAEREKKLVHHAVVVQRFVRWHSSCVQVKDLQWEVMGRRIQRWARFVAMRDAVIREWYQVRMAKMKEDQRKERHAFAHTEELARPDLWKEESAERTARIATWIEESRPLWEGMRKHQSSVEEWRRAEISGEEESDRTVIASAAERALLDAKHRERVRLAAEERERKKQREDACNLEEAFRAAVLSEEAEVRSRRWSEWVPVRERMLGLHSRIVVLQRQRDRKVRQLQCLHDAELKRARRAARTALRDERTLWERHVGLCEPADEWSAGDSAEYDAVHSWAQRAPYTADPPSHADLPRAAPLVDESLSYAGDPAPHAAPRHATDPLPRATDPLSYVADRPSYVADRPSYVADRPSYVSSYVAADPADPAPHAAPRYATDPPSYATDPLSYVADRPSYVADRPPYVADRPSYVAEPPPRHTGRSADRSQKRRADARLQMWDEDGVESGSWRTSDDTEREYAAPYLPSVPAEPPPGTSLLHSGFFEPESEYALEQVCSGEAQRQRDRFFLTGGPSAVICSQGEFAGISSYSDYAQHWRELYSQSQQQQEYRAALRGQKAPKRKQKEQRVEAYAI